MKTKYFSPIFFLIMSMIFFVPVSKAEELSLVDLPFSGYYLAPEASGIEGLLFQENQLIIYIKDDSRYTSHTHEHSHEQNHELEHDHEHELEHEDDELTVKKDNNHHQSPIDQPFIEWLFEFNTYPYPDLQAYSSSVQDRYKKENNLPIDLKNVYHSIADQITPEMTQRNILDLINQTIPDISYTQKNNYNYFIVSCPTITFNNNEWTIKLFGEEIFVLSQRSGQLIDNYGNTYEYIDGIKPN